MRTFSIQAPQTVGLLWEWLMLAALRRENVLAARSTFVNVIINGNDAGVYFLMEHFGKELLEIALLEGELRIKDARMARVMPTVVLITPVVCQNLICRSTGRPAASHAK